MNLCSLTTKERLSTAPPATNIPSIHAISENVRNWDGKSATVKNLCKTGFAAGTKAGASAQIAKVVSMLRQSTVGRPGLFEKIPLQP